MIPRLVQNLVLSKLKSSGKIILILGARQVGKTTLVKEIGSTIKKESGKILYLNCDIEEDKQSVNTASRTILESLLSNVDVLIIDEGQRLDNPGLTLKIIHDNFPKVRLLATGSSSFDLKNRLSDALTGRYLDFALHPFSLTEILPEKTNKAILKNQADALLPQIMIYGSYPEVYLSKTPDEKQMLLEKIVESYLFRDILMFQGVRNSQAIRDLTKALAYQIGSEVNENELSNRLKIDRKTVVSYLDILEKSHIIVSVHPLSRNPRREIGKLSKVYFVDLGIRNTLIGDFNPLSLRADNGAIWENFLFIERRKLLENQAKSSEYHFWRSYSGAEVDYIERVTNENMNAFEFKYGKGGLSKGARSFTKEYETKVKVINSENYLDFIT